MMLKKLLFCTIFILIIFPSALFANSAEPPGMTVVVPFPPEDLKLSLRLEDGQREEAVRLTKDTKLWEAYYRFYYHLLSERREFYKVILVVESAEKSFECQLPISMASGYNNLVTLDYENEKVEEGSSPVRAAILIALRVVLTLLIEGIIFFAFGYRKRNSWIIFFVINLITQGFLNFSIIGPLLSYYWFMGFLFLEIIIFIAEAISYSSLLKEHKKSRAIVYALTSNFVSLVLGGILISILPV